MNLYWLGAMALAFCVVAFVVLIVRFLALLIGAVDWWWRQQ